MADYTNSSQQRILKVVQALAGHEITGVAPAALARDVGCSAACITRDLDNLHTAGMAEQVPDTGRWRLGPALVQIALKHMNALDRAEKRLAEVRNRFSREAA
jgi:DNA-binding IclR family transcriptional regulator